VEVQEEALSERPAARSWLFAARLGVALVQALAIWLLSEAAADRPAWPATDPPAFWPLILASALIPLVVLQGLSRLKPRPLAIWALVAAVVVAALGWYAASRGAFADIYNYDRNQVSWPDARLWAVLIASLFIAQALVVDSAIEGRLFPSYPLHFDTAWTQGVQVVLTVVFVGVFWSLLELGAALFELLKIDAFQTMIRQRWFACPATTLAVAVSIHVTDVQPALIRGARSLALTLFSWLAPLLSAIVLGFLVCLPFVSLKPLWDTHFAAQLLLFAAATLIFLINCCYQDGGERSLSRVKKLAASVGAAELPALVGLAAWAIGLRVGQYGWTVERITAVVVTIAAAWYALGYASALLPSSGWLKRLEITNFATAYVVLGLVLALFSPLADPSRLMVADQMARLRSGAVKPEAFDFAALKIDGARWGETALRQLGRGTDSLISASAKRALAIKNRYEANATRGAPLTALSLSKGIAVVPADRSLPQGFYDALLVALERNDPALAVMNECSDPSVSAKGRPACTARWLSVSPGKPEAILLLDGASGALFEEDDKGRWAHTAQLTGVESCPVDFAALNAGPIELSPHPWPDLIVAGKRFEFAAPFQVCMPRTAAATQPRKK
jgi:hypothetical protein